MKTNRNLKTAAVALLALFAFAGTSLASEDLSYSRNMPFAEPKAAQAPSGAKSAACPTGCTAASFDGCYTFGCHGTAITVVSPVPSAYVQVGTLTCSAGVCAGSGTLASNGTIVPVTFSGPITVADDCTGSVVLDVKVGGNPVGQTHVIFASYDGGQSLAGMITDSGNSVICEFNRR